MHPFHRVDGPGDDCCTRAIVRRNAPPVKHFPLARYAFFYDRSADGTAATGRLALAGGAASVILAEILAV